MIGRPRGSRDRGGACVRAVPADEGHRFVAHVGARIRVLREECDVSASELAAAIDVDPLTVHNWEAGRRRPTLANCYRIAAALGVRVADVVAVE